ncbi:MAG TPA: hypothetical protein VNV66_18200 [Pilimelia sp.]|nr:hypothetical protein [Pilimelia sp.]
MRRRVAAWTLAAAVVAGLGLGCYRGHAPAPTQPAERRYVDPAEGTAPASPAQCDLDVAQRDAGWVCPRPG